ncbi:MAG: NADH-quinone oxidoreductase subunit B family protein [Armatimonadota bacterium]
MGKPKVAIFDFACCEGCQLQIVNMEEELLDLISVVEPVEWREAMSEQSETYDIAIIEGSITRDEDAERLREIREQAKILIALGACATIGGVNKLKNNFESPDEVQRYVYGDAAHSPHLATAPVKAVGEVVKVDYLVHGCPINLKEFTYVVRCLALGTEPVIPNYPVCVECKMRENICRYEYGEICLGPVIRAGCNAPCPTAGFWCFGCRGYVDEPNVNAAKDVMERYRKTFNDLQHRLFLFNSKQEPTNV